MDQDIKHIIRAGTLAPSGENAQPWRFKVVGNTIELHNNPDSDQSPYNWGQRASYLSNGAALENMLIAASALGCRVNTKLFPDLSNPNLVAELELQKTQMVTDKLYPFIDGRVTNRKPYSNEALTREQIEYLSRTSSDVGYGSEIFFTQDEEAKKVLGRAGGTNEEVMMSNREIHDFFFDHVTWTKEEDNKKKVGFYIKTLELPKPAQVAFRLFRHWLIMSIFNKLGAPAAIGKQNGAVYAQAGAIGVITIPANTPTDYLMVGRVFERLWLKVTELGLSLQPMTGVLFFMLGIKNGVTASFSSEQLKKIKQSYADIEATFKIEPNQTIALMFRIGKADKPTAQARKFDVEDVLLSI
jgi:nitroreductase